MYKSWLLVNEIFFSNQFESRFSNPFYVMNLIQTGHFNGFSDPSRAYFIRWLWWNRVFKVIKRIIMNLVVGWKKTVRVMLFSWLFDSLSSCMSNWVLKFSSFRKKTNKCGCFYHAKTSYLFKRTTMSILLLKAKHLFDSWHCFMSKIDIVIISNI